MVPQQHRRPSKSPVIRAIGTIASLGLLVFLLSKHGWRDVAGTLREIALWQVLLAFAAIVVSRFATVARWHVLLKALDIRIPAKHTLSLTFAGLFASNFLPTTVGGDIARLAGAVQLKYDAARCAASLVLDRLVGMFGMLMIMPFGIPVFPTLLKPSASAYTFRTADAFPLLLGLSSNGANSFGTRVKKLFANTFGALGQGMKRPGHLLGALGFTCIHMLGYFTSIAILLVGMQHPLSFLVIAEGWTIVYFLTLLPISINGLGVQEISVAYVYTCAGVPAPTAMAVALLLRTFLVIASLPGAAFVPSIAAGLNKDGGN